MAFVCDIRRIYAAGVRRVVFIKVAAVSNWIAYIRSRHNGDAWIALDVATAGT